MKRYMDITNLIDPSSPYVFHLAKDIKEVGPETINLNPLNELRLYEIPSGSTSIKMPSGYRMATSTLFMIQGKPNYLLKRQRTLETNPGSNPETFKFRAELLDFYPSLSEGASVNTLKLVFPEGAELRPTPREPSFKSCYIAVSEDSLEKHMLSFVTYSESLPPESLASYNLNNFRSFPAVFADKAIGLISQHHDNHSSEKFLRYVLAYVNREAVGVPIEVGPFDSSESSATSWTRWWCRKTASLSSCRSATRCARACTTSPSGLRSLRACPASQYSLLTRPSA